MRRPQNFAKSSPYFWLSLHSLKGRWRFRKILLPSQNIWTLISCSSLFFRCFWSSYVFELPGNGMKTYLYRFMEIRMVFFQPIVCRLCVAGTCRKWLINCVFYFSAACMVVCWSCISRQEMGFRPSVNQGHS